MSPALARRLAAARARHVVAGNTIQVALSLAGRNAGQGVGYLEDGAMVVVDVGVALVDAGRMPFTVSSVVPTSAGRIVFARLEDARPGARPNADIAPSG